MKRYPLKINLNTQQHAHFRQFSIYINSELEEIQTALQAAVKVLKPGGRLVVISFHSLEDQHSKTIY